MNSEQLIIAGPCAAETPEQVRAAVTGLLNVRDQIGHNLTARLPIFKPRTEPGFDGLGLKRGLPLLIEASREIPVGTEVLSVTQAWLIFTAIRLANPTAQITLWDGSRNQNHMLQQTLGKMAARFPNELTVLTKNQPWRDEKHLTGIAKHLQLHNPKGKNIFLGNRGFSPNLPPELDTPENRKLVNPHGFRNVPDFEVIRRVKQKTGIGVLLDPSHIGGDRVKVRQVLEMGGRERFDNKPLHDGLIIEAHPNPQEAWTDALQQLQIGKPLVDAINLWLAETKE